MASRGVRYFIRNAWDKEPVVVLSIAMGVFGMGAMYLSPYTYQQNKEMQSWPNMYNFYDLPTQSSKIYDRISPKSHEQPVWRTDYDN